MTVTQCVSKHTDSKMMKNVLDYGFVRLVDSMGNDKAICEAARVSYNNWWERKPEEDRALIRYLMAHRHTSPFEMVEFKFHCKMPIFVARQWIRHRTANVNEVSGRYSELSEEYYVPELSRIQTQSSSNKQGSAEVLPEELGKAFQDTVHSYGSYPFNAYKAWVNQSNLSRELARIILPLSTYTEWYWKIDLHNLFHFLKLRMDSHAQWEIQQYANAMYELIKPIVPVACEAFEDYSLNAVTFSVQEMKMLKGQLGDEIERFIGGADVADNLSKRELEEFKKKLGL